MSNKQRNAEALLIHRPVVTGQIATRVEAAVCGIVLAIFGVDLLPPGNPAAMWQAPRKQL